METHWPFSILSEGKGNACHLSVHNISSSRFLSHENLKIRIYYRTMARPQVADGGDGLQIRRVAANILNKQLRTADKGLSSNLGLDVGKTYPHRKK
jgi:hypothetical protein